MGTSTREVAHGIPQYDGGLGFQHWKFRMEIFLDYAGVLANLTDDLPVAPADQPKFKEADRRAKQHIVSFLANECLEVVREKKTAKAMWTALDDMFAKKTVGSQNLIRKQLNRLKLREGESMRAHLLVFEDLVRQLKSAGRKLEDADLVVTLFRSLPDSYYPLVTALENVPEEELTLEVAKQRLLAEEQKQIERHEQSGDVQGVAHSCEHGKRHGKNQGKCHRCGKRGHFKKDCRAEFSDDSDNSPEDWKKAVSFVANRSKRTGKVVFKLDSGASEHLVKERVVFSRYRKLKQPVVINVAKEGASLKAKSVGEIRGVSNKRNLLHMKDVLHVPGLRDNLMSVKKLAKAGIDVVFAGSVAILKFRGTTIATGHLKGDLYEITVDVGLDNFGGQSDAMKAKRAKDAVTARVANRDAKGCAYQAVVAHEQEGDDCWRFQESRSRKTTFTQVRRGG